MRWIIVTLVLAHVAPAAADPSERTDRARVLHSVPVVLAGAAYLIVEFPLKTRVSHERCWWCDPPGFDRRVRALRWDDPERASVLSNVTGFVLAPVLAIGGLAATTAFDRGEGRRVFDDVLPVIEAGILAGVINETIRITVPRARPFARFRGHDVLRRPGERNMSFFSGHTALDFALATSAGTVASLRGYGSAPLLWSGGLGLAVVTAYLRIAADAHYLSDVTVGALVGTAIGVAVPLLLHRDVITDEPSTARLRSTARPFVISVGRRF